MIEYDNDSEGPNWALALQLMAFTFVLGMLAIVVIGFSTQAFEAGRQSVQCSEVINEHP